MNPRRKNRLLVAGAVLCGMSLAAGLVLYALSASIDLFYTPEEIHFGKRETGQRPVVGQRLRVGGMVKAGSVKRSTETLAIAFNLYDARSEITVHYTGILPDLFREEQGGCCAGRVIARQRGAGERGAGEA